MINDMEKLKKAAEAVLRKPYEPSLESDVVGIYHDINGEVASASSGAICYANGSSDDGYTLMRAANDGSRELYFLHKGLNEQFYTPDLLITGYFNGCCFQANRANSAANTPVAAPCLFARGKVGDKYYFCKSWFYSDGTDDSKPSQSKPYGIIEGGLIKAAAAIPASGYYFIINDYVCAAATTSAAKQLNFGYICTLCKT